MTTDPDIELRAIRGIPEIVEGDDLGLLIFQAGTGAGLVLEDGDILIVAQKVVSKAEGRLVDLRTIKPSVRALELAAKQNRDPRLIEVILSESALLLREDFHVLITETVHGFVCANAGVDRSNVDGDDWVSLLPADPDASARSLKTRFKDIAGVDVAVIITDTIGRAWREGLRLRRSGLRG